jgi:signal transduction histidine kinase
MVAHTPAAIPNFLTLSPRRPGGKGKGEGLSISWDIVAQQHGGSIEVASRLGEFTEFTIRVPRNGQAVTPEAAG